MRIVEVEVEVEVVVDVDVTTDTEVMFSWLVSQTVLVCWTTEVVVATTWDVLVEVNRIVSMVVADFAPVGTLYTATDTVPTMIRIPTANTLTRGEIPFRVRFQGTSLKTLGPLPILLGCVLMFNP